MLVQIIKLLQSDEWLNVSPEVEIAKGRDEIVDTTKKFRRHARRARKSRYYGKEV